MKKIILLILISSLFSCYKNKSLEISELDFSDVDQKSVLKNSIKKTFLISGNDSWHYKKSDTIGIYEYDQKGNTKNVWRKAPLFSHEEEYIYDSLNLAVRKIFSTDFIATFNFRYEFDADSLILYQYYTKPTTDIADEDFTKPAGTFKFTKNGVIAKSSQYQNNDQGKDEKFITTYTYDSLSLLATKEIKFGLRILNDSTYWKQKNLTKYYYSDKKIDSSVTLFNWLDHNKVSQQYSSKTIYDENGLRVMNVLMDSLFTYYRHVK